MAGWFRKLFKRSGVLVPGTDALVEGEARKVDIGDPMSGGLSVLLCRLEGKVYAIDTVCPHENGRMRHGPMTEGKYVTCPLHSYSFDPRTGNPVAVSCRPARTFRVLERDGSCEIFL